MKRSKVLALRDPVWVPVEGTDLEVMVVPSAAAELGSVFFSPTEESSIRRVCTRVFTDFRNYTEDDGTAIPNSLAARIELFSVSRVRNAITTKCAEMQDEAVQGEGDGGSD